MNLEGSAPKPKLNTFCAFFPLGLFIETTHRPEAGNFWFGQGTFQNYKPGWLVRILSAAIVIQLPLHISAVKFDTGYQKNISFFVIPKSPKVREKKVEKIGWAFLS